MTLPGRPLPEPDPDSRPFWDGCRAHRLLVQRCADCETPRFPPGPHCPACHGTRARWTEAAGTGRIYSWIVVRHPVPREIYAERVPYVVALVELPEGIRLPAGVVGCDPTAVTAGMPVEVDFEDVTPEVTLPRFRPARGAIF